MPRNKMTKLLEYERDLQKRYSGEVKDKDGRKLN